MAKGWSECPRASAVSTKVKAVSCEKLSVPPRRRMETPTALMIPIGRFGAAEHDYGPKRLFLQATVGSTRATTRCRQALLNHCLPRGSAYRLNHRTTQATGWPGLETSPLDG
jgi:hypothetical protein